MYLLRVHKGVFNVHLKEASNTRCGFPSLNEYGTSKLKMSCLNCQQQTYHVYRGPKLTPQLTTEPIQLQGHTYMYMYMYKTHFERTHCIAM